jgi:hypothetical protein
MAKVNLKTVFYDLDDVVIPDKGDKPLTLYSVLRLAATSESEQEQREGNLENKVKAFDLFLKIREAGPEAELELTSEEVVLLKKKIGNIYTTIVAAQTAKLLEGKDPYGGKRAVSGE